MSSVAKQPVTLPQGVTATIAVDSVTIKGGKGTLSLAVNALHAKVVQDGGVLKVENANGGREADYRASLRGTALELNVGFSHPVVYDAPEGITIETPTQTEILVKGTDIQKVGQVAADIRNFRPPEPYKGKGVRYSGEKIELKEAKKK